MADPIVRPGAARGWSALAADPRALAGVLDDAPYPAWIHEIADGYPCVAINGPSASAYDLDPIDLVGIPARDTMTEADFTTYDDAIRELLETRMRVSRRIEVAQADVTRQLHMEIMPILDEHGAITHVFGVARDVTDATACDATVATDTTEAEAALRESESHFRELADTAPVLIWTSDHDGSASTFNQGWLAFRGRPLDDELASGLFGGVHPDDREHCLTTFRAALATQTPVSMTHRLQGADGEYRWMLSRAAPRVLPDGTFLGHVGASVDVAEQIETERRLRAELDDEAAVNAALRDEMTAREELAEATRRSEERFRALVENAPDMIAILDRDGRLVEGSPSAADALGIDPLDLAGEPIFDRIHPDDREEVVAAFRRRLAHPDLGGTVEFRLAASDGTWRMIQAAGSNLFEDPAVGGFVVNARDVTERRQLEDQLARAQQLETVRRLAGGIAHDFDDLITTISGSARLLLVDVPDTFEHRVDLEALASAADRATALVEQLLAFARKEDVRPTIVDVHEVITSMEVMLRRLLGPAVGLAVGGPGIVASVSADRSQIEQVFSNLVVNARDACSTNGGQIVVRTEIADLPAVDRADPVDVPPGRYVIVSVRDDGSGMDLSTQAQAFEPFFTTKEGKGTGLGLSIVASIVDRSGGSLHVESEPDSGTTVRVYLPYAFDADSRPEHDTDPEHATPVGSDVVLGHVPGHNP